MMTYDQWKTRAPEDDWDPWHEDDYDPEMDCEHDDYDIDVCLSRASCNCCSKVWYLSAEEVDAEQDRQASYQEDCECWERQQLRREFWRKLTLPIRWPIFRLMERIWPRKSLSVLTDDEIPF